MQVTGTLPLMVAGTRRSLRFHMLVPERMLEAARVLRVAMLMAMNCIDLARSSAWLHCQSCCRIVARVDAHDKRLAIYSCLLHRALKTLRGLEVRYFTVAELDDVEAAVNFLLRLSPQSWI